MPRALTIHRTVIPPPERARYFARLKARETYFAGMGCRFWAFEEHALPGAFVEFCEADSPAALTAAHAAAPDPLRDPGRIYTQLELS